MEVKEINPTDTFFQRREAIFRQIYAVEDTLLAARYNTDTLFWKTWFAKHAYLDKDDLQSYLSDMSYRSDLSNNLSPQNLSALSEISNPSNLSLVGTYFEQKLFFLNDLENKYYFKNKTFDLSIKYSRKLSFVIQHCPIPSKMQYVLSNMRISTLMK